MDSGGLESPAIRAIWTFPDPQGHGLEIYGSGGWVFDSPRARNRNPLRESPTYTKRRDAIDGCGHRWTRTPTIPGLRGLSWTSVDGAWSSTDQKVGVRVPPGVLREAPGRAGVRTRQVPLAGYCICRGSDPREPFSMRVTASRRGEALVQGLSDGQGVVDFLTLLRCLGGGFSS
jgi:hypothetical protein